MNTIIHQQHVVNRDGATNIPLIRSSEVSAVYVLAAWLWPAPYTLTSLV